MFDSSRTQDLLELKAVRDDEDETPARRRRADRTMKKIVQKMRDPIINGLRSRLVGAHAAGDEPEAEKITLELQAYERRHYPN